MITLIDSENLILRLDARHDPWSLLVACAEGSPPPELQNMDPRARDVLVEVPQHSTNLVDVVCMRSGGILRHRLLLTASVCLRVSLADGVATELAPFPLSMVHGVVARVSQWEPRPDATGRRHGMTGGGETRIDAKDAASLRGVADGVRECLNPPDPDVQVIGLRRRSTRTGRDDQVLFAGTPSGWFALTDGALVGTTSLEAWRRFAGPLGSSRHP